MKQLGYKHYTVLNKLCDTGDNIGQPERTNDKTNTACTRQQRHTCVINSFITCFQNVWIIFYCEAFCNNYKAVKFEI